MIRWSISRDVRDVLRDEILKYLGISTLSPLDKVELLKEREFLVDCLAEEIEASMEKTVLRLFEKRLQQMKAAAEEEK